MKKFLILLILFFWAGGNISAVPLQDDQIDQLRFEVDYACFRTASDFNYLEVYYGIFRKQLKFVPEDDHFRADFQINTKILMEDSVIVEDSLRNVTYADSLSQITPTQKLANLSGFIIREGAYKMLVKITDLNADIFKEREMNLEISPISKTDLTISDIELASRIKKKQKKDKFTKNKYQVIPNPSGIYGTGSPILYFYAEIYNLKPDSVNNKYRSLYTLLDANGNEVRTFRNKVREKPGKSSVEVSGFNIISLQSGTYFLKLGIEDLSSKKKATALKKFFVYRSSDFQEKASEKVSEVNISDYLNSSEYKSYDDMNKEDLEAEFAGATYIATKKDKEIFKELDLSGKRNFIKRFWLMRDRDRSTVANEFRKNYLERLQYVNNNFGSGKPGWKSDRGRVMLVYGDPSEVERFPSSSNTRAYEIWHYYKIQGGVLFIFVDVRGFGDYQLVHSTARDELHDYDWRRWIDMR